MPNFQVFPRHEAVSLATLDTWLSAYLAGTLMPTFRSGPGADDKWLQASEWREQIQQNSQNMKFTLVAFTARWCGFCKGVPPLIKVIDKVKSFVHLLRFNILTISKILSQEALPVAVKLFDVDINDAAVASSLVNVTTIPTLILIPPLPSDGAASHGSSTMYGSVFPLSIVQLH
jgi:thiol-disulfide isomerase/thioredoxin